MQSLDARELLNAARDVAEKAYAPYSNFPVGAALLSKSGEIFLGVNVENVSYGLTICAERSAIAQAVTAGHYQFQAVALWASSQPNGAVAPCGACRQILWEFLQPETPVITGDPENIQAIRMLTMKELLPLAFDYVVDLDGSCLHTNSSKPVD